ncbi:MAG: PaaI family thioesterase [Ruminococcaceae bacterium]|nr:PaaI family thioesterase [Oscillospiraceae bacterium]
MTAEERKAIQERHQAAREKLCGVCAQLFPDVIHWDTEAMEMLSVFHTDEQMENTRGWLHGGLIATIFDNGLGILADAHAGGDSAPTSSIHVEYLRPVPLMVPLYLHAKIVKLGRTLIHVRGELLDAAENGKTLAAATGIFFRC